MAVSLGAYWGVNLIPYSEVYWGVYSNAGLGYTVEEYWRVCFNISSAGSQRVLRCIERAYEEWLVLQAGNEQLWVINNVL